jgi:hypothetical protein
MLIEVKFDTVTKKLEITSEGKKIKNVTDVSFLSFNSEDSEFFMDVTTVDRSKQEDDGLVTRTHLSASKAGVIEAREENLTKTNLRQGLAKVFG